jgi:S1-C subfamily serine protease
LESRRIFRRRITTKSGGIIFKTLEEKEEKMKRFVKLVLIIIFAFLIGRGIRLTYDIQNSKLNSVLIEAQSIRLFSSGFVIGTGVVIDSNGTIITARHCVEGMLGIQITLDGKPYLIDPNKVVLDKDSDIALIRTGIKTKHFAKFENSDELSWGSIVYAIGTAEGIFDNYTAIGYLYRNNFRRMSFGDNCYLMTRLNSFPGMSGGGVYHWGKLIGLLTAGYDGYTFVISEREVRKFLQEIKYE